MGSIEEILRMRKERRESSVETYPTLGAPDGYLIGPGSYIDGMTYLRKNNSAPLSIADILTRRIADFKLGVDYALDYSFWWKNSFDSVSGGAFDREGNLLVIPYSKRLFNISNQDRRFNSGILLTEEQFAGSLEREYRARLIKKERLEEMLKQGLLNRRLLSENILLNEIMDILVDGKVSLLSEYNSALLYVERAKRYRRYLKEGKIPESSALDDSAFPQKVLAVSVKNNPRILRNGFYAYLNRFFVSGYKGESRVCLARGEKSKDNSRPEFLVGTELVDCNQECLDEESLRRLKMGAPFRYNGVLYKPHH